MSLAGTGMLVFDMALWARSLAESGRLVVVLSWLVLAQLG